jgi:hypothetical protein
MQSLILQVPEFRPETYPLWDEAYSLSLDVRWGRGTNTPQSIVFTVPGRASSNAIEIL